MTLHSSSVKMQRKYIMAVLLLLALGVISTLAISFTQVNLEESWGAEYTVSYEDAELQLRDPDTTINNATSVTVVMNAYHSTSTVKARIVVEAQDSNTNPITVDATGSQVTVIFEDTASGWTSVKSSIVGAGNDYRAALSMSSAHAVDKVTVIWGGNAGNKQQDGFTNTYQYGSFTVTDIE